VIDSSELRQNHLLAALPAARATPFAWPASSSKTPWFVGRIEVIEILVNQLFAALAVHESSRSQTSALTDTRKPKAKGILAA
jgi:hypothetical protein